MKKLDLARIWRDHNASFSHGDWFLFYFVPTVFGAVLAIVDLHLNATLIGLLATALSVFCALLFGLLIPVIDQARRLREQQRRVSRDYPEPDRRPTEVQEELNRLEVHSRLAEQLFANVCFAILISLASVILLIILAFAELPSDPNALALVTKFHIIFYRILSACGYTFIGIFFLTLAMLLRRMYVTFVEESHQA